MNVNLRWLLVMIGLFVGIIAYNIYVPDEEEYLKTHHFNKLANKRGGGVFSAIFYGLSAVFTLYCIHEYARDKGAKL